MNETAGVVVYSTPNCAQCGLIYRVMDTKGIEYTVVDLSTNKVAVEYVTEDFGYSQAPVVVASDFSPHMHAHAHGLSFMERAVSAYELENELANKWRQSHEISPSGAA